LAFAVTGFRPSHFDAIVDWLSIVPDGYSDESPSHSTTVTVFCEGDAAVPDTLSQSPSRYGGAPRVLVSVTVIEPAADAGVTELARAKRTTAVSARLSAPSPRKTRVVACTRATLSPGPSPQLHEGACPLRLVMTTNHR
jgi:hypothetical protein